MSTAEQMVYKYSVKESNLIKKLCDPLKRYLDIEYFWYSHTTAEGSLFSLGSNPSMHEYYFASKLYVHSPFFHRPDLIQPGFYSYRSIQDSKFQQTLDSCVDKVNINLGMSLVMKHGKDLLRFGYASDASKGPEFMDGIINNLPLLKKFNAYFISETKHIVKSLQNDLIDLPSELGDDYTRLPKGVATIPTCYDKCAFLHDLGMLNKKEIGTLTKRELDCLEYLPLTSREIGDILHISSRTVEAYLQSAKNKLNCYTKSELIHKAEMLHISGFFD
jgi:DNA-binding CsgD family transcriptional regulator